MYAFPSWSVLTQTTQQVSEASPIVIWKSQSNVVCNLAQCVHGSGITRESAIVIAATALDLATDVLSSITYASKNVGIFLLTVGSHQYPCTRPLACENPVWSEAWHRCLPQPQRLHDHNRLHQDHRYHSFLPPVLMVFVLVAS